MIQHTVYTVRQQDRFWAVYMGDREVAGFRDYEVAQNVVLVAMEKGCEASQASQIVVESSDGISTAYCPCFGSASPESAHALAEHPKRAPSHPRADE
jgi:hypothetical protein